MLPHTLIKLLSRYFKSPFCHIYGKMDFYGLQFLQAV